MLCDAGGVETHVATSEVTALEHELRDHAMELGAAVAKAFLTRAKSTKVLSGLGGDVVVKVEVDAAILVYDEVSQGSYAMRQAGLRDLIQWYEVGQQSCFTFDILGRT